MYQGVFRKAMLFAVTAPVLRDKISAPYSNNLIVYYRKLFRMTSVLRSYSNSEAQAKIFRNFSTI